MKGTTAVLLCAFLAFTDELNATSLEEKLIGGEPLLFGSMLFVVSIHKDGEHKCAGSLISQNHVLSVAQCLIHIIKGGLWSNIYRYKVTVARFGRTDVLFDVTDMDIYKRADIGLLLIESNSFRPVETILPAESEPPLGHEAIFVGRYADSSFYPHRISPQLSLTLNMATMIILDNEKCQEYYSGYYTIQDNQLCAMPYHNETTTQYRDIGSPLIYSGAIVGLHTFDLSDGTPGVFVRVAQNIQYIERALQRLQRNSIHETTQLNYPLKKRCPINGIKSGFSNR